MYKASDLARINHMETDTTLANLRHEYHSLKNQLNDITRLGKFKLFTKFS